MAYRIFAQPNGINGRGKIITFNNAFWFSVQCQFCSFAGDKSQRIAISKIEIMKFNFACVNIINLLLIGVVGLKRLFLKLKVSIKIKSATLEKKVYNNR